MEYLRKLGTCPDSEREIWLVKPYPDAWSIRDTSGRYLDHMFLCGFHSFGWSWDKRLLHKEDQAQRIWSSYVYSCSYKISRHPFPPKLELIQRCPTTRLKIFKTEYVDDVTHGTHLLIVRDDHQFLHKYGVFSRYVCSWWRQQTEDAMFSLEQYMFKNQAPPSWKEGF